MKLNFQKGGHLFTFFCLYIAQSIPMSFFSTVLPVIMRQQNFSLETIGMLQLLKLPWILKFLWSPAVDRTTYKLNDFKRWIFSSELIYASIILAVSFLDFQTTPYVIIGLIILSFIASATQDIATDSLAVLSFSKKDKSLANSMQSMGSFAGAMIGGGFLLLLYHQFGWGNLLPFLALFVIIAIIPLFFFKGGRGNEVIKPKQQERPTANDILGFFKQKGIGKQIIFLFLYYAGLIGVLAMLKPMLVDYGYSIKQIGIMSGIVGTSIGCIASFCGGFIVRKIGRHAARILFAVCTLVTTIYFCLLVSVLPVNIATLHLGISLLWGSYGISVIVVYTTAMDCVRPGYEGTDFTIQTVITHLSGIIMGVSSGKIAAMITYKGLFVVEMCIAAISLTFILFAFKLKATKEDNETRIIE
ncbi:MFS transporter [Dysgonomonas sp. Marseille-P4677]|uniref:MFS transporter n=1 Tax=Dysgonomonas sp. Marseille-P4677 TaxID=2364790 RepID=UPI001912724E|nr:MFS transporter [Dysgonomonas sp. Marseille-P4677]MBK5722396.1 MFS transporter [Dysgonomonas sp. Marseille-P4677]